MSTATKVKKAMLSMDKTSVDENYLEITPNSIIHCLGSLFQDTNTGLKHIVGKKIDNDTYFANPDLYIQLNELTFVEQLDVTSKPNAAPMKEGLLTSAYRFMTAPFSVGTPSNVMTRNRHRKSSVRSNLDTHLSDTPFTIRQPIWRPHLLERVYKPIHTLHWCRVLQSSITESIRDRV